MIIWLDHLLFGNGYGLKSPHCDNTYYWLNGRIYTWIGGLGAQLQSFQWIAPNLDERRAIRGRIYKPFSANRVGPRVRVTWQLCTRIISMEDVRMIKNDLDTMY